MNLKEQFDEEKRMNIKSLGEDHSLKNLGIKFLVDSADKKYSYNFSWLGRPIIQLPQDMIAMQEIIWNTKPDLLIETGIAHGGSLIFYASLFEIIGKGQVVGIDIDIRPHNRKEIEKHPLYKRIKMIEGSSVSPEIIKKVSEYSKGKERIMVVLDSNHTHEHVFKELELYSPLVSKDSYLVVFDTVIEDMSEMGYVFPNRLWGKGNNPKTAVNEFLKTNPNFVIDNDIENKLLITVAPGGYLKKIK